MNQPPEQLNILLADDTELNLTLAAKLLSRKGHRVVEAVNGRQAVEKFKEGHFDVVLMDVRMPIMDGLEATRKIREWEGKKGKERRRVPVIALTANDDASDRTACLEAGMDGLITKPLNVKTLMDTIREIMDRPERD